MHSSIKDFLAERKMATLDHIKICFANILWWVHHRWGSREENIYEMQAKPKSEQQLFEII